MSGRRGSSEGGQARRWAALAGVLGGAIGAVLAAIAIRAAARAAALAIGEAVRVFLRAVRIGRGFVWFWYATFSLQLLRRCPDCRRLHRGDARVCRHCGYRRGTFPAPP